MGKKYTNVPDTPLINPREEVFGAVCSCAVRYALGRKTYMPDLVKSFILPYIPFLSDLTLEMLERDITEAEGNGIGYGDETIDKPGWMKFLYEIQQEVGKRKKEK